ncbi:uncharacterized protein [Palaemon carinicauda]|uniref:uncharacterized protein n=1 Tax=Palaemon carinicauda TaxID=392227 RepID=UPI0035B641D2
MIKAYAALVCILLLMGAVLLLIYMCDKFLCSPSYEYTEEEHAERRRRRSERQKLLQHEKPLAGQAPPGGIDQGRLYDQNLQQFYHIEQEKPEKSPKEVNDSEQILNLHNQKKQLIQLHHE